MWEGGRRSCSLDLRRVQQRFAPFTDIRWLQVFDAGRQRPDMTERIGNRGAAFTPIGVRRLSDQAAATGGAPDLDPIL